MKEVDLKVRFEPDMACSIDCDFAPTGEEPTINKCLLFQQPLETGSKYQGGEFGGFGKYIRCDQCFQRFGTSK